MAVLALMVDYKLDKLRTRLSSFEQMGLKLFEVDARLKGHFGERLTRKNLTVLLYFPPVRSILILEQEFPAGKTILHLPLHLLENNLGFYT